MLWRGDAYSAVISPAFEAGLSRSDVQRPKDDETEQGMTMSRGRQPEGYGPRRPNSMIFSSGSAVRPAAIPPKVINTLAGVMRIHDDGTIMKTPRWYSA